MNLNTKTLSIGTYKPVVAREIQGNIRKLKDVQTRLRGRGSREHGKYDQSLPLPLATSLAVYLDVQVKGCNYADHGELSKALAHYIVMCEPAKAEAKLRHGVTNLDSLQTSELVRQVCEKLNGISDEPFEP